MIVLLLRHCDGGAKLKVMFVVGFSVTWTIRFFILEIMSWENTDGDPQVF